MEVNLRGGKVSEGLDVERGSLVLKDGRGQQKVQQKFVRKSYFEESGSPRDVSPSSDVKVTGHASGLGMDDDYCGFTTPSRLVSDQRV